MKICAAHIIKRNWSNIISKLITVNLRSYKNIPHYIRDGLSIRETRNSTLDFFNVSSETRIFTTTHILLPDGRCCSILSYWRRSCYSKLNRLLQFLFLPIPKRIFRLKKNPIKILLWFLKHFYLYQLLFAVKDFYSTIYRYILYIDT